MIGKEKIKYVRSLHQKKFRQKYNKFIAEGPKVVSECMTYFPNQIDAVYGLASYLQTLNIDDPTLKEKLIEIGENNLKKISALDSPNQVVAVMRKVENQKGEVEGDALYLDNVQNPNNVGAILRIAEWYDIPNIILSHKSADIYSPKVIQASMGSFLRLKYYIIDQEELRKSIPNHTIVVADGGGTSLKQYDFATSTVLVMGNEGHGPSKAVMDVADAIVSIDRVGSGGHPESLNVAVAAGVLCDRWRS